jgi:GMP synthase-like glutamine amidotransferase
VRHELRLVERAVEAEVPVLGLCFGGQALATVLGGFVERATGPELGWVELDTRDPEQVPRGPWLAWHWDRFVLPDDVEELASTAIGSQAFRSGPHLGVQFHPESRIEQVSVWARKDAERTARVGIPDGVERLEAGREHQTGAVDDAYKLFDGFWDRARKMNGR